MIEHDDELSHRLAFLNDCGGNWKILEALAPDCGHRRYWRVECGRRTAILVYDDKTLSIFLKISDILLKNGFFAPKIYETMGDFALLQDFGKISLRDINQKDALEIAIDTARDFRKLDNIDLPKWQGGSLQQNRKSFVLDYLQEDDGGAEASSFEKVWQQTENSLPEQKMVFVHGDFHLDNLMALPNKGCGILDFQDAMIGSGAYDAVNLLEDARADIPQALRARMIDRYCKDFSPQERQDFDLWYRVLGTQFHMRVLGLFTKIGGDYAAHIPRLVRYVKDGISHPALCDVNQWLDDYGDWVSRAGKARAI